MYLDGFIKKLRLAILTEHGLSKEFGAKAWNVARIRSMDDTLDTATRNASWRASEIIAAKHLLFHWKHPRTSALAPGGSARMGKAPQTPAPVATGPLRADH